MANGLDALISLRRNTLAAAQSALAAALRAAAVATHCSREAERAIQREMQLVADSDCGDDLVESLGRWLPVGQARVAAARAAENAAEAEVERCRAQLTSAQVALKIVEDLQTERQAAAAREALAKEQRFLDDLPRSPPNTLIG